MSKTFWVYFLVLYSFHCFGDYDHWYWDGCFEREVATFEKVQLESARIVTGLTKFASRDSLYYETGWAPLLLDTVGGRQLHKYRGHTLLCIL
jgi:hypothetical protein